MITVNGDKLDWHDGMTVQDVLNAKRFTFRSIGVRIDGKLVEDRTAYSTTPVPDLCDISVIHGISGG